MVDELNDCQIKIKTLTNCGNVKAIAEVRFSSGIWIKGFRIMYTPKNDCLFADAPALIRQGKKPFKMFWDENADRWHELQNLILKEYEGQNTTEDINNIDDININDINI